MSKIIFGFLGKLPNLDSKDNWEHWKKFFETNNDNKNNIHVLLHPIVINEEKNKKELNDFNKIFNLKSNLHIVDESNHVLTEWGTNSLADATLLMLQESYQILGDSLKKFVLLSPTCCPIYSLDYIYSELINDNKSWIRGDDLSILYNSAKETTTNFKFFKDDNYRDEYYVKYSLYFSNWMILDIKHIYFFLLKTNIENKDNKTYVKVNEEPYTCKFEKPNERVIINPEYKEDINYQKLNDFKTFFSKPFLEGSTDYDGNNLNYCWPIEEIIFGNWILKTIVDSGKNILDELKYTTINFVENQMNINKLTKEFLDKAEVLSDKFINVKPVENNDVRGNSKFIKGESIALGTEYPYLNNENIRLLSPTYINWTKVSLDPHNIFRGFKMKEINFQPVNTKKELSEVVDDITTLKWNNFDINSFLENTDPQMALQQLIDNDEELKSKKIKKLINNEMAMTRSLTVLPLLPSTWHPLEFSSWSLKNMINAFILLSYFKKIFIDNIYLTKEIFNFNDAYEFYRSELLKKDVTIRKIIYDDVLLEIPVIENKKDNLEFMTEYQNNNYGTVINSTSLINARVSGSLFIRKCNNGSKINLYSDILLKDPNDYIKQDIGQIIQSDIINYGIYLKSLEDISTSIERIRELNFDSEISTDEERVEEQVINTEKVLEKKEELNRFIMRHISLLSSFIISNEKYVKFTLPNDVILKVDEEIGTGEWNKVYKSTVILGNNKLKVNDEVVLRTMFNNTKWKKRNNAAITKLSFFDNFIGIILTILQNKVFNIKITNDVYFIGYDTATKIFNMPPSSEKTQPMYIASVNEKVDGTALDYLKDPETNNFNFETFLKIFYQIVCKLDLLQNKLKFFHGDLKLDNVFYRIINYDVVFLISDLGNSTLTINGVKIRGNPDFKVVGSDQDEPYYGKDILYFIINALREVQIMNNQRMMEKILDLLKNISNVDEIDLIDNNEIFMPENADGTYNFIPSKIFNLDNRYEILKASNVKKELEKRYSDVNFYCKNIDISRNNSKYYKKYIKYKNKYINLKKM